MPIFFPISEYLDTGITKDDRKFENLLLPLEACTIGPDHRDTVDT